ncbi:MAG: glycosyltransferase family 2 protein [Gaiellaceae bacterium]|jgi:glycosyltransferase involved in cell wall biosynthesis
MRRIAAVVPTHNRPDSLARCVDALERQRNVPGLRIVVVDDGSVDPAAVAAAVARSHAAQLLRFERARGPAAARNLGARNADADVVLFTDDDCEPAPDWAATLAAALARGAGAVAGITVNGRPGDALASASETILDYVQERARDGGTTTHFAATNNLGVDARVLAEVPFDETYRYGEDRDWCARTVAAGHSVHVDPRATVVHHQHLDAAAFLRQQYGYGRGSYRFRRRHAAFARFEAPRYYTGLLARGFEHGVLPGLLVGVAQAATAAGFLREALRGQQGPAG